MPEGAEVRTIVHQLRHHYKDATISDAKILSGRYVKHGAPKGFDKFVSNLPLTIIDVSCRGKFIYMSLSNGSYLTSTLGMTGSWRKKPTKHSRMIMETTAGALYFDDIRNFGTLNFENTKSDVGQILLSLGWDPLAESLDYDAQISRMKLASNATIAEALMDQRLFSGVGNYVKAEVLYRSKISPWRLVKDIDDMTLGIICEASRKVLIESFIAGGTTIHDYADASGNAGSYQQKLQVYGRSHDNLGNKVIRETTRDDRTTHWVPDVQK